MRDGVAGIALSFLFLLVAFQGRSLVLLLGALGAISLVFIRGHDLSRQQFFGLLLGPYLPFVVVTLVLVPFQERATDAFWLLSIPVSYVLARLLRLTVRTDQLAMGIAIVGFFLGGVIAFGRGPVGGVIAPLEDLALYLHKNVYGWIAAFGLVMSLYLIAYYADKVVWQAALGGLSAVLGVFLFFSGSMTGFLGAAATMAAVSGVLLLRALRKKGTTRSLWWDIAPLGLGAAMTLVFVLVNVSRDSGPITKLAERDFGLTGRTNIWAEYVERLGSNGSVLHSVFSAGGEWRAGHATLHNSFLEAHSVGGILLAVTLLGSIAWAIFQSGRALWSVSDDSAQEESRFGLAIAILGLLIALVESYIFSQHVYASLVVFLGPAVARKPRQWADTRFGRFLLGGPRRQSP